MFANIRNPFPKYFIFKLYNQKNYILSKQILTYRFIPGRYSQPFLKISQQNSLCGKTLPPFHIFFSEVSAYLYHIHDPARLDRQLMQKLDLKHPKNSKAYSSHKQPTSTILSRLWHIWSIAICWNFFQPAGRPWKFRMRGTLLLKNSCICAPLPLWNRGIRCSFVVGAPVC